MENRTIANEKELEFAVFCIENTAIRLNRAPAEVYRAFTVQSDILYGYIVPEYETLHTQSKEYIVDEIIDLMKERAVTL